MFRKTIRVAVFAVCAPLAAPVAAQNASEAEREQSIARLSATGSCPRCDLSGADLSGVDLSGTDIEGADLSGAYLLGANLEGANLEGANLTGADLTGADLSGAILGGADLSRAILSRAIITGAILREAVLTGAFLNGADLREADLREAYLRGANLRGADLRWARLNEAVLREADLSVAFLSGANLRGADLSGANLIGAGLFWTFLNGADLSGANLEGAFLEGANLTGADLSGAILREAYLSGAYFGGADLSGADLSGAGIHDTDLTGADLTRADLSRAILAGADLTGAVLARLKNANFCRTITDWGVDNSGCDAEQYETANAPVVVAGEVSGLGIEIDVAGEANGTIVIDLFEESSPAHAAQVTALAASGAYDGVVFHRVIDGFMAQTGDVQFGRMGQDMRQAGMGGSELPDLPLEAGGDLSFERGSVGMARSQDPDSANSQFFIMFEPAAHLDGGYTIIGKVVSGLDVLDAIKLGRGANGAVIGEPDMMAAVRVIQ